jgi:hypothetical protein
VTQNLLTDDGAGPTTQQGQQMQRGFRNAPRAGGGG